MKNYCIADAIVSLHSNCQFTINADDYSSLRWLSDDIEKPTLEEINDKLLELESEHPMKLLRQKRNELLFESDWRATVDYPGTDKEAWLTYRQALRDLPAISEPKLDEQGNIINVTWPTKPE